MDDELSISIILNNGIKNSTEDSIESDFFKKKYNYWINDAVQMKYMKEDSHGDPLTCATAI